MTNWIGQTLGNYTLIRLLASGGFGDVYLGENIHIRTQVAIKVLQGKFSSQDKKDFENEARTIAALVHPHIVRLLDFGEHNGMFYMVMEYAANGTLRDRHPSGSQVPLLTVVSYTKQIADALQYAHANKIVHRDIKPENIFVGHNNEILVGDFGIAVPAHRTQTLQRQAPIGTPAYMAPEQFQGWPRPASDQYALGVMVCEWLSGISPPFLLYIKIPAISPAVEQVVFKALEKDPKDRFVSIQEFASALEQASQSKGTINFALQPTIYPPQQVPTIPAKPSSSSLGNLLLTQNTQVTIDLIQWSNGQYLALRSDSMVQILDTITGDIIFSYQGRAPITQKTKKQYIRRSKLYSKLLDIGLSNSYPSWVRSLASRLLMHPGRSKYSTEHPPMLPLSPYGQWSPVEQTIAIGDTNGTGTILLWNADLRSQIWATDVKNNSDPYKTLHGFRMKVSWLANGKYLLSEFDGWETEDQQRSSSWCIDIWNRGNGQRVFSKHMYNTHPAMPQKSFNDEQIIFTAQENGKYTVHIWDASTEITRSFSEENFLSSYTAWSHNGKSFITFYSIGLNWDTRISDIYKVSIRDSSTGQLVKTLEYTNIEERITLSPNGMFMAFIVAAIKKSKPLEKERILEIWDLTTYQKCHGIQISSYATYEKLKWASDMRNIFLYKKTGVEVWNIASEKQVASYDVSIFALSPDETRIATMSNDKTLQLWEVTTRNHLFTYPGYDGRIKSITWAPDGKRLAIVLDNSTVQILQAP